MIKTKLNKKNMSEIEKLMCLINDHSENGRQKSELESALKLLKQLCLSKKKVEIEFSGRSRCVECNKIFKKDQFFCQFPCKCLQTYHTKCLLNRLCEVNINKEIDNIKIDCRICKKSYNSDDLKKILGEENYKNFKETLNSLNFKCDICLDKKSVEEACITLSCDHRVCDECLKIYMETKIDNHELPLKCPSCPKEIDYYIIKNLVSSQHFCLYDMSILQKLTSVSSKAQNFNEQAIKCPNADCKLIFIVNIFEKYDHHTCERCKIKFCVNGCQRPHEKVSCEDFKKWLNENDEAEVRFEVLLKKEGWAKCPKCGSVIERIKDCPHMKCIICKIGFCYIDKKIWGSCEHSK